jgi:hypothetical protein
LDAGKRQHEMQLPHDEMYYDRTWFDELGAWLLQTGRHHMPRRRGQLWSTGFALFAGLSVAWAAGLATHCVVFDVSPNESLAQLIAAMLLLVAARHFLAATGMSAISALSRRKLISRTEPAVEAPDLAKAAVSIPPRASSAQDPRQGAQGRPQSVTDPKIFFSAVKDAGINVRIARTLYSAGFRSGDQIHSCDDAHLLAIEGIGQATLRKLRLQFGLPGRNPKPQSNAA